MKIIANGHVPEWIDNLAIEDSNAKNSFENSIQAPFQRCLPYIHANQEWPAYEGLLDATKDSVPVSRSAWDLLSSLNPQERSLFVHEYELGNQKALKKFLLFEIDPASESEVMDAVYKAIKEKLDSPLAEDEMIDMSSRRRAVPAKVKKKINNVLHEIGLKRWEQIPLEQIFWAVKKFGLIPLQEDGTEWSGFLSGAAECGSEKARDQVATFPLAMKMPGGEWAMANINLFLSWCVLNTTNGERFEIVTYAA